MDEMDRQNRQDGSWNEYSDVSDEMRMLDTFGCNDDDTDDYGDDNKNNDDDNVGNNCDDDDDESG